MQLPAQQHDPCSQLLHTLTTLVTSSLPDLLLPHRTLCRALNTLYFDWFVNSPGAVLTISNCIMIDPNCNAISPAEDLTSAQSLPQLPQQRRNLVSTAPPFCMALPNGTECFQHGVLLQDVAVVLASDSRQNCTIAASAASAAKAAAAGHFIIQYRNTTRVCRQYLDPQCLQETGGNRSYCWQQAVRVLTGAGTHAAGGASAGVIAGAVVGGERPFPVCKKAMNIGQVVWHLVVLEHAGWFQQLAFFLLCTEQATGPSCLHDKHTLP